MSNRFVSQMWVPLAVVKRYYYIPLFLSDIITYPCLNPEVCLVNFGSKSGPWWFQYVSESWVIIGLFNDLWPILHQAIIKTNIDFTPPWSQSIISNRNSCKIDVFFPSKCSWNNPLHCDHNLDPRRLVKSTSSCRFSGLFLILIHSAWTCFF